jgi:hypothetical protein
MQLRATDPQGHGSLFDYNPLGIRASASSSAGVAAHVRASEHPPIPNTNDSFNDLYGPLLTIQYDCMHRYQLIRFNLCMSVAPGRRHGVDTWCSRPWTEVATFTTAYWNLEYPLSLSFFQVFSPAGHGLCVWYLLREIHCVKATVNPHSPTTKAG